MSASPDQIDFLVSAVNAYLRRQDLANCDWAWLTDDGARHLRAALAPEPTLIGGSDNMAITSDSLYARRERGEVVGICGHQWSGLTCGRSVGHSGRHSNIGDSHPWGTSWTDSDPEMRTFANAAEQVRPQGQIVDDHEAADMQAARDGYNPSR